MSIYKNLIEAGADRIWNDLPNYELAYPECERIARYVLDAFLDYLTTNRITLEGLSIITRGPNGEPEFYVSVPEDGRYLVLPLGSWR